MEELRTMIEELTEKTTVEILPHNLTELEEKFGLVSPYSFMKESDK